MNKPILDHDTCNFDGCNARLEVLDSVNGRDIAACGWYHWALQRFGRDIGWEKAAQKAKEHDVQPQQAAKHSVHKHKTDQL